MKKKVFIIVLLLCINIGLGFCVYKIKNTHSTNINDDSSEYPIEEYDDSKYELFDVDGELIVIDNVYEEVEEIEQNDSTIIEENNIIQNDDDDEDSPLTEPKQEDGDVVLPSINAD